jgi:hypothetical protein
MKVSLPNSPMENTQAILEFISGQAPSCQLTKILACHPHADWHLTGWKGLYSLLAQDGAGARWEIDVRWAWSKAVAQQHLWDFGWQEGSLLENRRRNAHKLIVYCLDPSIDLPQEFSVLPGYFALGRHWRTISHLYSRQTPPFPLPGGDSYPQPVYSTTQNLVSQPPAARQQVVDTHVFQSQGSPSLQTGGLRTQGLFKTAPSDRVLLSIVTVVYNGAQSIEQTIQSVLNQSYEHLEYIIIDGGSTDGTLDIIRRYEDRINYWISDSDQGIYSAMNKGTRLASGSHVLHLNADDLLFSPDSLAWLHQADCQHNYLNGILKVDPRNNHTVKDSLGPADGCLADNTYHRNPWFALARIALTHPGFVGLITPNSLFDEGYRIMSDTIMLAKKVEREPVHITDRAISIFRTGGASANNRQILREMGQEIAAADTLTGKIKVWLKLQGVFVLP